MKKLLLLFLSSAFIIACSSVKQTEEALNTGNYDQAIGIALKNLSTNKHKKGKQEYIIMLEQAFAKAKTRDKERIAFLSKTGNGANLEEIFNIYNQLKNRQERIKPLLPLRILEKGRNANFQFENYNQAIIETQGKLAEYLYNNASELMSSTSKFGFRQAYEDFKYLDKISPNYKDTRSLIEQAHIKGTDFVIVDMKNQTRKVIPKKLEEDLLNFSTYGLNDLWTVYHNNKQASLQYDFSMDIELREINISPEQIREKHIVREKQILDGKKDLLDSNGNVVKDSLGNVIQVDRYKTIVCDVTQFTQFKATQVKGQVKYKDLVTKQLIDTFPLESEFIFEHSYATYNGDRNALDATFNDLIRLRAVPFPSNEQMIFDSGEDLKAKLKEIITRQAFR
ncbi:hypothetical protein [Pseudofulvibacter geojedonensis]|uniref:Lipoprotein n=1 Tax=Pseudofulvibacter geojedonensis TaxID=1123758 RepID=A0ABW3HYU1_9FLAO